MQYSIARYLIQSNLIQKLGLPSLVLASLLGTSPVFAATQISSPAAPHESSPVLMANLFRRIRETVRDVTDTINTIDSSFPRGNGSNRNNQSPQPQPAPPSARPAPAESPASRSVQAIQILHRDDAPRLCRTAGERNCEAFQITRRVLPSGDVALIFSFFFDGTPVSFVARDEPSSQQGGANGYTSMLFDNDPSRRVSAFCEVGPIGSNPYAMVVCSIRNDGPRYAYLANQLDLSNQ